MRKILFSFLVLCLLAGTAMSQSRAIRFTTVSRLLTVNAVAHNPLGPYGEICLPEFPYEAVTLDARGTPDGATVNLMVSANGTNRTTADKSGVPITCPAAEVTAGCIKPVSSAPQALKQFCAEITGAGASTSITVTLVGQ